VLQGINESAYQKKIPLRTFFAPEVLVKALEKESRRFVIVISESKVHSEKLLWFLNNRGIHPIFINVQFSDTSYFFSSVMPNLYSSFYKLTRIILEEFSEPAAFVGFNKDSIADKFRLDGFKKAVEECNVPDYVFENAGDADQCISDTVGEIKKYRNIICTNDVMALLLMKKMKETGCDLLDYNITGYSNMKMGEFFKPSLTTTVGDYYNAGILAVEVFVFLSKKKHVQNLCINMESDIIFRDSTHQKTRKNEIIRKSREYGEMVDFFGNESINKIDIIESMLINCDNSDIGILHALLNNKTYEEIAETYFMAVNTVKYRVKKIENRLGVKNRNELCACLRIYDLNI
jgi:DNA-binding LacI/PurR family transcriptional regulator